MNVGLLSSNAHDLNSQSYDMTNIMSFPVEKSPFYKITTLMLFKANGVGMDARG